MNSQNLLFAKINLFHQVILSSKWSLLVKSNLLHLSLEELTQRRSIPYLALIEDSSARTRVQLLDKQSPWL